MGDELLTNRAAFPSAVLQIRKMLVAATPLANPLALTGLPSEQATPVKNVSHPKTPVLAFEGKVKQQVKSRKRTSKKSKVKNLAEHNLEKEIFSEDCQRLNFHPLPSLPSSIKHERKVSESFLGENDGSVEGQKSTKRKSSSEGQPRKKKRRKYEENMRNADENSKNSKKLTGEDSSAGEAERVEKVDKEKEMVLVTELGVVERYKIGYICRSFEDLEGVESSSTSGDTIGIKEDMRHLDTADSNTSKAIPMVLGDVCGQEHANVETHVNGIGHVMAESACLKKSISSLEAMEVKNDPSELPMVVKNNSSDDAMVVKNNSSDEAMVVKNNPSEASEHNSSAQPTIVGQLWKTDKVEHSPPDTMQADHLLKVFNWQVAGAICAIVLEANIQGARICQRREELVLLIARRLEEESRNLELPIAQELQLTPKIIQLMRQQLGEWAEEDQKEKAMVECETVVRKQKLEEVLKETDEAVQGESKMESECGVANILQERVSKAGKEAKKKKKRCHRREIEVEAKEEGELDSSVEKGTSLVLSSCQEKSRRLSTKRIFTLGLS